MSIALRDAWLLPTLESLLTHDALARLTATTESSYWLTAVREGLIDDATILEALASRNNLRVADLTRLDPALRDHLPESLARKYHVVPVLANDEVLEVATSDPTDLDCERALEFATGRYVRFHLASPARLAEAIDELYRPENAIAKILENVTEKYDVQAISVAEAVENVALLGEKAGERPVIRLVDYILAEAITARASDIHVEPEEKAMAIRYRIDGVLRQTMELPRAAGGPLVSRVKIMSGLDIADRLRPQDGRARVTVNGTPVDLRISTLPAAHGEKVVIRILDQQSNALALDKLGLDDEDAARLERLLGVREGIILVTGPTGSGKTTTLYSALKQIKERDVNIVTVEDPVEYRLPGVVQVQVNEKAGLTFASALRSILRQDPDVVLVGEIRDRETAGIAVQASLTGHLVFSTLHTIDAASSVTRLVDIGVEPYKIAAALKGVIAQRLVRRLCLACRTVDDTPPVEELRPWIPEGATIHRAVGCPECASTGYRGRAAITEILMGGSEVEQCIAEGGGAAQLTAVARDSGMRTLFQSGLARVLSGVTSLDELLRVTEIPSGEEARTKSDGRRRRRGGRAPDSAAVPVATRSSNHAPPEPARLREASALFASEAFQLIEEATPPLVESPRVLFVSDDDELRGSMESIATVGGLEVEEARDMATAVGAIDRDAPDLVVLDLSLPGTDGWDSLTRLRARPGTRHLPVVVLCAEADEEAEVRAFTLGAHDVVGKPVRPRAFAARLHALLGRVVAEEAQENVGAELVQAPARTSRRRGKGAVA